MRTILFLILITFASLPLMSQSLQVIGNTEIEGLIGEEIEANLSIKNISSEPVTFYLKRLETKIGSQQKAWFCLNGDCSEKNDNLSSESFTLKPEESLLGFKSILKAGLSEGYSTIKYQLIETNTENDPLDVELIYSIVSKEKSNVLYSSNEVVINDIYPNPVSEFAVIKYNIKNKDSKVKIVLHSVLGSILGEYNLQPLESNLKISVDTWNPGVYFYTLYIDNDGVMTRKLVVRK